CAGFRTASARRRETSRAVPWVASLPASPIGACQGGRVRGRKTGIKPPVTGHPPGGSMTARRIVAVTVLSMLSLAVAAVPRDAVAQAKPEGEMRFALYVTISPQWFDPGEVTGQLTPFWILYAMHDALVKAMPGNLMSPSLAESWTVSPDQKTYEF